MPPTQSSQTDSAGPLKPFDRIVALAKARGLSERKASEQAGLNPATLADARRNGGNMQLATIEAFAKAFELPLSQLLGETATAPAALSMISQARLHPSPLNPRKRFDPDSIDDLAASVHAEGVLLPLLVRRANQPGNTPLPGATEEDLEIIAGERRWRAVAVMIAKELAPADYPVPYRLIDPCSDRKHLEIALTENVARRDMTPLEEAQAFAQLAEQGAAPSEIADVVGLTTRTVQKRLRLVKDLTPQIRTALANGDIMVETANVLAAYCPKSKQNATLRDILDGHIQTTAHLKKMILMTKIPEASALFDAALYKGGWIEDEDVPGLRYFEDAAEFGRLQQAAVDSKIADLGKTYGKVEVYDRAKGERFESWNFREKKGHALARAIVEKKPDGSVEIHLNMVAQRDLEAPTKVAPNGTVVVESEPTTKAHNAHANRRKTEAMQTAVAGRPIDAMRLVCLGLLGGSGQIVKLSSVDVEKHDVAHADPVVRILARHLEQLCAPREIPFDRRGVHLGSFSGMDYSGTWSFLVQLPDQDITELFSALVALRVGTFTGWPQELGDDPTALAIADTLGLVGCEQDVGLTLQPEDLDGLRKDTLLSVAKAAEVGGDLAGMTAGDLKTYIAAMAPKDFVLPSLRFGDEKSLKAALRAGPRPAEETASSEPASKEEESDDEDEGGLTPLEIAICRAVRDAPSTGIAGADLMSATRCEHNDIVLLVRDLVLWPDSDNRLSPGYAFPSDEFLSKDKGAATAGDGRETAAAE